MCFEKKRSVFIINKRWNMQTFLRCLITLFGAAAGGGLGMLGIQGWARFGGRYQPSALAVILLIWGGVLLFGIIFWFAAPKLVERIRSLAGETERSFSDRPLMQILSATLGLVLGLVVASLITQLFRVGMPDLLWAGLSSVVYMLLGYLGASVFYKRWREMPFLGQARAAKRAAATAAPLQPALAPVYLDTSALIDGRVYDVCRLGFVPGPLVAPQFILDELRHIADSADPLRRARGRRGLDILEKLQKLEGVTVRVTDENPADATEADVKLLKLAQASHGAVMTGDFNLAKVAAVAGVKVLNLNDLTQALRPPLLPGEAMRALIVKEGKEPGQGVAYLDDGTMLVVENGRAHIDETVDVVVTSVLQTSAGRMIFAKVKE